VKSCKTCELWATRNCLGIEQQIEKNKKRTARVMIFDKRCGMYEEN